MINIDEDVILGDIRVKMIRSTTAPGSVSAIITSSKRSLMGSIYKKMGDLIDKDMMSKTMYKVKVKPYLYDDESVNYIELISSSTTSDFGNIPLIAGYIAGLQYN